MPCGYNYLKIVVLTTENVWKIFLNFLNWNLLSYSSRFDVSKATHFNMV